MRKFVNESLILLQNSNNKNFIQMFSRTIFHGKLILGEHCHVDSSLSHDWPKVFNIDI